MKMQPPSTIRLLVVEVDADKLTSLQSTLTRAGYTVLVATSEDAAVACVTRERVHLVLIGDAFVAKHGLTLCVRLRRSFVLPIVILALLKHPDDLATALHLGADDYIIMPVHDTVLLARLAAILRRGSRKIFYRRSRNGCSSTDLLQ